MRFFRHRKLRDKILTIATVASIALITMIYFSFTYLEKIADSLKVFQQKELKLAEITDSVKQNLVILHKNSVSLAVSETESPKLRENLKQSIAKAGSEIQKLTDFANGYGEPKLRDMAAKLSIRYKGLQQISNPLLTADIKTNKANIFDTLEGIDAVSDRMFNELNELSAFAKESIKTKNSTIDQEVDEYKKNIFLIGILGLAFSTALSFAYAQQILISIKHIHIGIRNFSAFLIYRQKSIAPITVSSEDEFADMAKMINENIETIQAGLKKDSHLIAEVSEVATRVKNGFYSYKVENSADNEMLEELKNKFNEMIEATNENINKLIVALSHYGNSDFTYHVDTSGASGNIASLVSEVNELGVGVSELIAIITASGEKLQMSTKRLSSSAETLSSSSSEQAASLEQTASAIEEITSTIRNTAEQADVMARLAVEANASAKDGDELAKSTKEAMEEIARATDAINEAVTIVDKIAFQTNILSLNATVEAARAGDAGKGFAVVAGEVRNLAARSQEAARKITELVEVARKKAEEGRHIATTMKEGFEALSQKTSKTSEIVEFVAIANKEQMAGIEQINDSLIHLDRMTQENSRIASDTSLMSREVRELSEYMMRAASRTKFKEEARDSVQNVDLVFDLARIKQDIIAFKERCFEKLSNKEENITVEHSKGCSVGIWIEENKKEPFARTQAFDSFVTLHEENHGLLEEFIAESQKENSSSERIRELGFMIELNIQSMFAAIDGLKRG